MNYTALLLACISLLVLVLGLYVWKLTSSRPTLINMLLSSAFLLLSGYALADKRQADLGFAFAFFAAVLCIGRAGAFLWRSRKEPDLGLPGVLMAVAGFAALSGTVAVYLART